ncbi:phosphatidate cytidylyltransferase [Roseobacter denitrificans]|uniref:Phosphatidate cytidylyltransferase n=1 Tax=Roseobacter denitrificans (strain ATCC 33942 / OCh 114) TaxID=375451 RepID=Q166F3_ROSDO|nr:phosphatidate cytidylyltransferase [Roseobacter denitrificans]ABG32140.1 phosphatidate cytidylyltransferase [Roseobacter denitrificans OCh 114]AVL51647.1 phosphatidate cytidylyltransferase [Roseobacter denitrificans]SFF77872.1 phosphatidate cytidylyltransferase [Roseobacter denitrificans OCh 114]
MGAESEKWADLAVRLTSGAAMVLLGLWGVWMGGHVFHALVALICGLMIWELVRMLQPRNPPVAIQLGLLGGAVAGAAIYLPVGFALPILIAPALVGFGQLTQNRALYMVFTVLVLLAGFGMMSVRDDLGFGWMLWLVLVVVATDVVGYFAGRMIGGPKFWPRVSPKKTWAGTAFGWVGAAAVGAYFVVTTGAGAQLVGVSVAVSMASQMGDIAESAIKRRVGIKDSSNLIPGHGGLLDRFDGMLGAAVFLLIIGPFIAFPPGIG